MKCRICQFCKLKKNINFTTTIGFYRKFKQNLKQMHQKNSPFYYMKVRNYLFITLLVLIFGSCNLGKKSDSETQGDAAKDGVALQDFISEDDIFSDIDKAKKIFYSLPSPLETAMLIKSAGAEYDEELLNSLNNTDKYTTSKSLALNLGIYTTDLSFASLFDQTQTSISYMEAAKKMAEGLDITDAIDDETINKLEQNLDNRDMVMDIISETFLNSSSYLKENERQDVAAIVLVGGWIEGLYIASKIVGDASIKDNKLVDRILEQKLSFNIVQRMLDDNKKDTDGSENQDIIKLISELEPLKKAFDKVTVEMSKIEVEKPTDKNKVSTLKSETKVIVTQEDFKKLREVVIELRTSFIQ